MVYHVMKDGSRPTDITGRVIRMEDAPTFYQVIHNIKKKSNRKKKVKVV